MTDISAGSAAVVRARADELRAQRVHFVLATVVRAERPTSAKPGDAAVVLADGTMTGFVGGDCARSSVQVRALEALSTGEPVLLRIAPSESIAKTLAPSQGGSVTVVNPCLSGGTLEVFLEPWLPPPLLVVHGDAPIAHAVADLAQRLGYAVSRAPTGDVAGDATAVVVASHGRDEADVLVAAARAGVPYIGLVASPRRGAAVLAGLDLSSAERAVISTPAGLDIGARTPEEVALSILAEIVSRRPRRAAISRRSGGGADADADAHTNAAPLAVDPVCGMAVVAVDPSPRLDVDGARYWFCGSGCRDAFAATPEKFAGR